MNTAANAHASNPRSSPLLGKHCGIDNGLHWALDVSFGEDLDRKRVANAAQNFFLLNRIALNLFKDAKTCKLGSKASASKQAGIVDT